MNWLKKKVIKWVREDWENASNEKRRYSDRQYGSLSVPEPAYRNMDIETNYWMDIRVQSVTGGTIVSFTNNRRNDPNIPGSNVYIVQDGENLGEAIGKLITTEQLRR